MLVKRLLKVAAAMVFMFSVVGCGEDGGTKGTLTLAVAPTDLGGGVTSMKVTATVSPAAPKMEVSIKGKHFKKDGTLIFSYTYMVPVNPQTGIAEQGFYVQGDLAEITYFEVNASIEGLFKVETVSVPLYTP